MSTNTKKEMYYIIILVLTLLIFVIAATFAYFTMSASKDKNSTQIYTGTIAINYNETNVIQGNDIIPFKNGDVTEPTFEDNTNVYKNTFTVSNSGTLDVVLTIKLDISINSFSKDALKYAIFNSAGRKITNATVNPSIDEAGSTQILLSKLFLHSGNSSEYTVIIWLNETGVNQDIEKGKSFSGNLSVEATNNLK